MLFINRYVDDFDTAEDLAEDVFVLLLTKKPRYKGNASFKTWLFTMGRNLSIDYIRKHRRVFPMVDIIKSETENAEISFFLNERKRIVYSALENLPDEEKLLMHLLYIEDMGYEQAEKVLKLSRNKLYSIARRAKERLKTEFEKEGVV